MNRTPEALVEQIVERCPREIRLIRSYSFALSSMLLATLVLVRVSLLAAEMRNRYALIATGAALVAVATVQGWVEIQRARLLRKLTRRIASGLQLDLSPPKLPAGKRGQGMRLFLELHRSAMMLAHHASQRQTLGADVLTIVAFAAVLAITDMRLLPFSMLLALALHCFPKRAPGEEGPSSDAHCVDRSLGRTIAVAVIVLGGWFDQGVNLTTWAMAVAFIALNVIAAPMSRVLAADRQFTSVLRSYRNARGDLESLREPSASSSGDPVLRMDGARTTPPASIGASL